MKKTRRTLCYVIILILLITTIQGLFWVKLDGVYKGMSYNDFCESRDYYQYGQYLFFRNQLGDHCVAYLSEKNEIFEIKCYNKWQIDSSDKAFSKISNGMSVYEVVKDVGIPIGSYTSGMLSLTFQSNTGAEYTVYFEEETVNNRKALVVTSVLGPVSAP